MRPFRLSNVLQASVYKYYSVFVVVSLFYNLLAAQPRQHDLRSDSLVVRWDEAIPLGNGMLGALVWQNNGRLRFSLDRADLWDLRPMKGLHRAAFSYEWVAEQVRKKEYTPVQQYFDEPYEREPAPSKIPGAALEFNSEGWGKVRSVHLYLHGALCEVQWSGGVVLQTFVHARSPVGWFRFENVGEDFHPELVAPKYRGNTKGPGGSVEGDDLARLGYQQGTIRRQAGKQDGSITYSQQGWDGFQYEVNVRWRRTSVSTIEGVWSISSHNAGISGAAGKQESALPASILTKNALSRSFAEDRLSHTGWWKNFWSRSAIHVPDTVLERQWWLEQYKFGAASRRGAPPISLQAVWTADNGRLPPWKGDYHHDLNTQLSYWPAYSGNHLEDALAFLDHLDDNKANYKRYTKMYFGKEGLAVPGVTTLDGTEMGGWIQYSLSPTTSAWLAQHYYLQWRYSMDRQFLRQRAYPWIKGVAIFLESITVRDSTGARKLPISSSPEQNDNDISAWFPQNTNFDLALMKFAFRAAGELARELGLSSEAAHWEKVYASFEPYALSPASELMVAPTMAYTRSHRHFSHLMAIHPLGLIRWEDGPAAQSIITNSLHLLDSIGPDYWCGYSYSWLANLKARAKDGEGAAKALDIFARAFCSPNSFHLNGDQTRSGYSKFQYRPFTLEGNFAYAAGLQEMLLQSYAGFIEVMPAVPKHWTEISFDNLRAEGAFLVSAVKTGGQVDEVRVVAEKGGSTRVKLPFRTWFVKSKKDMSIGSTGNGFITLTGKPGAFIVLKNGYE